ncbi:hypothetical protein [Priestia aryabhattai]
MESKNDKKVKVMDLSDLTQMIEEEFEVTSATETGVRIVGFEDKEKDEHSSDVPELTIEVINKKIKQYEILTGMSFNEYKRACESGKIKNFSQVGLDLWELIEEQKRKIEQKGIETNE